MGRVADHRKRIGLKELTDLLVHMEVTKAAQSDTCCLLAPLRCLGGVAIVQCTILLLPTDRRAY